MIKGKNCCWPKQSTRENCRTNLAELVAWKIFLIFSTTLWLGLNAKGMFKRQATDVSLRKTLKRNTKGSGGIQFAEQNFSFLHIFRSWIFLSLHFHSVVELSRFYNSTPLRVCFEIITESLTMRECFAFSRLSLVNGSGRKEKFSVVWFHIRWSLKLNEPPRFLD